ncbi:hypothetical protein D9613_012667 [Agrocybe pediades]|uniref:Uncharacterized protein n=1 Tax=Agrocybe pediades TaxID=84607 RepID=A0A8H4VQ02_9AGAR|nr:hypothetical protein D9613_012667 [Agrocybe pediades]
MSNLPICEHRRQLDKFVISLRWLTGGQLVSSTHTIRDLDFRFKMALTISHSGRRSPPTIRTRQAPGEGLDCDEGSQRAEVLDATDASLLSRPNFSSIHQDRAKSVLASCTGVA